MVETDFVPEEVKQETISPSNETPVLGSINAPEENNSSVTEFVVDPQQDFAAKLGEYGTLSQDALTYVLEQQQGNFTTLDSQDAAALLLAADKNSQIDTALASELKNRVQTDATAFEMYSGERLNRMEISQLQNEILSVDEALRSGSDVQPLQLKVLVESINTRSAELTPLVDTNVDLGQAIEQLKQNWDVRVQKVAAVTQASAAVTNSDNARILEQISDNAEIRTEKKGDEIIATVQTPDGEKEVTLKEGDIWSLLLTAAVSDLLLGTRNIKTLTNVWMEKNVLTPALIKLGIDPSELANLMGGNENQAFDGMLKVMDDNSCKKYFEDAVENDFLYEILKKVDHDHVMKIFNPDGTQAFGGSGFLSSDHLHLDQDLVQKMYDSLTERQREELKIPQRKVATA